MWFITHAHLCLPLTGSEDNPGGGGRFPPAESPSPVLSPRSAGSGKAAPSGKAPPGKRIPRESGCPGRRLPWEGGCPGKAAPRGGGGAGDPGRLPVRWRPLPAATAPRKPRRGLGRGGESRRGGEAVHCAVCQGPSWIIWYTGREVSFQQVFKESPNAK